MRTTVDIDPHLLERLRDQAHREGVSVKEMLNRVLSRGLLEPAREPEPYECASFAMGRPSTSIEKALALSDALHDEEVARELELRR